MIRFSTFTGILAVFIGSFFFLIAPLSFANDKQEISEESLSDNEETIGASGLPIPRFVSLKADEVNLRKGPGRNYKILWKYVRKRYPVKVTAEYGSWRKVQDVDGVEGWVHEALLSGKRTALITSDSVPWRAAPSNDAPKVAISRLGVMVEILECQINWCNVETQGISGWVDQSNLWGVLSSNLLEN